MTRLKFCLILILIFVMGANSIFAVQPPMPRLHGGDFYDSPASFFMLLSNHKGLVDWYGSDDVWYESYVLDLELSKYSGLDVAYEIIRLICKFNGIDYYSGNMETEIINSSDPVVTFLKRNNRDTIIRVQADYKKMTLDTTLLTRYTFIFK
jgi:hypothetical protein